MNFEIVIIGQGYVGLPLAIEFGKKYKTIGFDIDANRIKELQKKVDSYTEISQAEIESAISLTFSDFLPPNFENQQRIYIVTVPTPITSDKKPDLTPLFKACKDIGQILKKEDYVIFESTVYPGCTEDECVPILEKHSSLIFNKDFFCGYSPERINPGDKINTLTKIKKITSGSTKESAIFIDNLYNSILEAGTHKAESIKIAEAAKIIENCQRDINIAFMNEVNFILKNLEINTNQVLEAAKTKWNFLDFKPGLVGGNCIGVDPYYLIDKSEKTGYTPNFLQAARKVNESVTDRMVGECLDYLSQQSIAFENARVLILGFAFKPNSADFTNTEVAKLCTKLIENNISYAIFDPKINYEKACEKYNFNFIKIPENKYDCVIWAMKHEILKTNKQIGQLLEHSQLIIDFF